MFKTIKYISALTVAGVSLAACSDSIITNSDDNTISGTGEKTPVEIAVTLQDTDTGAKTRAVDGSFETDDQLIAYVQQVAASDATIATSTTITEKISKLVTWQLSQKAINEATTSNNQMTITSDNKDDKLGMTLYWDDFSNSTDDIRGEKRFLRVGYGYCYNGGTPSSALTEDTGKLGWTVQQDQSLLANEKKSDLLWASATVPFNADNYVKYEHVVNSRKPLPVTYTHAMSKVTIEINLGEGFSKFSGDTYPTLYANTTVTEVDAIKQTQKTTAASAGTPNTSITKMFLRSTEDKKRVYEAIIAPTVMMKGNTLCSVTVEGNTYNIELTDALLTTGYDGGTKWSEKLKGYNISSGSLTKKSPEEDYSETNGGVTLPGVNYKMVVNLKKQKIEVSASIADWTSVTSSTEGLIQFSADVTNPDVSDGSTTVTSTSFDLWMSSTNTDATNVEGRPGAATYDANTTTEGIQKASTYTYNSTTSKWEGLPVLYWPNGDQKYYFRALATYSEVGDDKTKTITSVSGNQAAAQGTDLLWAQTSKHTGAGVNYSAGAAINPRTGDVPLTFQHAMSKISVELQTVEGAKAVNLENSKISIINLYNGGTIDISNGKIGSLTGPKDADSKASPYTITDQAVVKNTVNSKSVYQWLDNIVIPQSLTKDRDNTARGTNPSYYSSTELIAIYPNVNSEYTSLLPAGSTTENTSLGTGEPKYYLPADLGTSVPTTYYLNEPSDIALINTHNANLAGSKHVGETKEPELKKSEVTYSQFKAEKMHQNITSDQFNDLSAGARLKSPAVLYTWAEYKALKPNSAMTQPEFDDLSEEQKKTGEVYTQAEIDAAIAIVEADGYVSGTNPTAEETKTKTAGEPKFYTLEEYQNLQPNKDVTEEYFNNLPETSKIKKAAEYYEYYEYHALDEISETLFNRLDDNLVVKPQVLFTEVTADEYNATLTGALHVEDVKVPEYYKLPSPAPTEHHIGDLKDAGNKIMLYVTLSDGTIYSIDLATCKDSTNKIIEEWEGGYHYKYTITLTKEEIKFRALVKNWNDVEGSGNATLDWD